MDTSSPASPIVLSIGIMAWNEEKSIVATLESLFGQSVFQKLAARCQRCEVLVLANGCSDGTVRVSEECFARHAREHPWRQAIAARAVDIKEAGRNNAWNRFVHEFSARETQFIALMDADILFHHVDTIYSLMHTMEERPEVNATASRYTKDIALKARKTFWDRLSLATSTMTATIEGQISGQLYCMRAPVARNIYIPRDFGAGNDDGYFKQAICTDSFTRPLLPKRIQTAPDAKHIFEAYVSPKAVLNNQKRQMIGQTIVHVLVEYIKSLPLDERRELARTLMHKDRADPEWFKRLIRQHIEQTSHFWQLFPGILTFRFKRCFKLPGLKKLTHFPAAAAGWLVTMISCYRAHRALRDGATQYWPKVDRGTILAVPQVSANK